MTEKRHVLHDRGLCSSKKNNVIIIFGFQCVCYYFLKGQKAIRKMLESEARDRRHATITDSRDQVADAHWERLRPAVARLAQAQSVTVETGSTLGSNWFLIGPHLSNFDIYSV